MTKILAFIIAVVLVHSLSSQDLTTIWQTESINEINREPIQASYFVFESKEMALQNDWQKSANYLSLNGVWKFNWVESPAKAPKNFYAVNFDDSNWAAALIAGGHGRWSNVVCRIKTILIDSRSRRL
ncbi:MAG: hypothetical protein ACREOI_27970 [bacterium]